MNESRQITVQLTESHGQFSEFLTGHIGTFLLAVFVACIVYRISTYSLDMHQYYKSLLITSINPKSYSYKQPRLYSDDDFNISDNEINDEMEFYQEDEYDNPLMRKFVRETIRAMERRKRIDQLRDIGALPPRPDQHFIDDFIDLTVYDHVQAKRIPDDFDKDGKLLEKAIRNCQDNYKEALMKARRKNKKKN